MNKANQNDNDLVQHFLKAVSSLKIGTEYDPKNKFRISNTGYNCLRKLQLDRDPEKYGLTSEEIEKASNIELESLVESLGASTIGTLIHEHIENALKNGEYRASDKEFYISSEEEISFNLDGIDFIGHYDLFLKHPKTQEKIVVDIKTVSSNHSFNFIPQKKHLDQLILYQYYLGKVPGYIFYITRDTGEIKSIRSDYTDKKLQKAIRRISLVQELEKKSILLPTLESPESFPCNGYCKWDNFCWKLDS
jgi:hypothetical protein